MYTEDSTQHVGAAAHASAFSAPERRYPQLHCPVAGHYGTAMSMMAAHRQLGNPDIAPDKRPAPTATLGAIAPGAPVPTRFPIDTTAPGGHLQNLPAAPIVQPNHLNRNATVRSRVPNFPQTVIASEAWQSRCRRSRRSVSEIARFVKNQTALLAMTNWAHMS